MNLRSLPDSDWIATAAAAEIQTRMNRTEGPFDLVLSGGSTPRKLHARLVEMALDWSRVRIWFGDERHVPLDHAESNYRMAEETLLSKIDPAAVFPMFRGGTAEEDAASYAKTLEILEGKPFDVLILGMGSDAHTASLFPGEPSIRVTDVPVIASIGHAGVRERITMTFPRLYAATETLLLIAGEDKKKSLRQALKEGYNPERFPIQAILNGPSDVTLFVDEKADPGV